MPALPKAVKIHILIGLACFEPPEKVVTSVKEEFGIVVSRQCVQAHDPERAAGARLAPHWRTMFYDARTRYLAELDSIPIACQSYRLRMLERIVVHAERMNNISLMLQVLEQAAKEVGGMYWKRSK